MNQLSTRQRKQIVSALVEGNSIHATWCMIRAACVTVTRLLVKLDTVCSKYQYKTFKNLNFRGI
jgi:hypothetical protein